jgi:hypothetical protein
MGGELGQRVSATEPRSRYEQTIGSRLPGLPSGQPVGAGLVGDQPVFQVAAHLQTEAPADKGRPEQLVGRASSGKEAPERTIGVADCSSGPLNKAT